MPTSTRQRTVVAAIVGCLSSLVSVAPAAKAAPEATPNAGSVTVAVTATGRTAPEYRIAIRNRGSITVYTTVRQELPRGTAPARISDSGQVAESAGRQAVREVSWRLRVPAGATETVATTLRPRAAGTPPVSAPACAFAGARDIPYDCASATWSAPERALNPAPLPWWRRPMIAMAGVTVLLLLAAALLVRRTVRLRRLERELVVRQAVLDSEPNLYPRQVRPAAPPLMARLPRPPNWLAVGTAAALLAGLVVVLAWATTARVSAIDAQRQPSSGAWLGKGVRGPVGAALRESAFEFTVYRVTCGGLGVSLVRPSSATPAPGARTPGGTAAPTGTASPNAAASPGVTPSLPGTPSPGATGTPPASPGGPAAGSTPTGNPAQPTPTAATRSPSRVGSGQRQCQAIVGVHNASGKDQRWYGALQRAYQPGGDWVGADEAATEAATGRDLFTKPVPAGERLLVPLVFTMPGGSPPSQLELRSAVFSAGVRVDVP